MSDAINLLERIKPYRVIIVYGAGITINAFNLVFKTTGLFDRIKFYAVTDTRNNPSQIENIPVKPIDELIEYRKTALVLISVSDKYLFDISATLNRLQFKHIMEFTFESKNWSILREHFLVKFYSQNSWHHLKNNFQPCEKKSNVKVFMIKSHLDREVHDKIESKYMDYTIPLQVGKALTNISVADFADNTGENISHKNASFCELTGHYWIWKNVSSDWVGVCHYRRHFELTEKEVSFIASSDYDVLLTVPILNVPNVATIYEKDHEISDWKCMMNTLRSMQPQYYSTGSKAFNDIYYYGYNMMIARKDIFDEYCSWLFPILFEIEKHCSNDRNDDYQKRYIGFLAERLTSLFFIHNKDRFKILSVSKVFYR